MKVSTYEGVVRDGRVQLPTGVVLPEKAKVFVVVPGVAEMDVQPVGRIVSPRLVHPEQASDFAKQVLEEQ